MPRNEAVRGRPLAGGRWHRHQQPSKRMQAGPMIRSERLTADLDGNFVVFLIGVRINTPLKIHKWLPVVRAMPRMLADLHRQPELGFIHAEMWFSRTTIMVQYRRSMDQLLAYAKLRSANHLPAWQAFNRSIATDGSVGIWHETYAAAPGSHESVYVNMPEFGLGRAGTLRPASEARNRLRAGCGRAENTVDGRERPHMTNCFASTKHAVSGDCAS